MRIVIVVIWIFLNLVSPFPVFNERPISVDDNDENGNDDSGFAKRSLYHYCLFHVDLRCRDSCIDLGFMNGKCYKGVCVCKGAERIAIRKLRLSGQMIVPYLKEELTGATGGGSSLVLSGRDKSNVDRAIVYNKGMLDDLVAASHAKDDEPTTAMTPPTSTTPPMLTTVTTHLPHGSAVGRFLVPKSVDEESQFSFDDITSVYVLEDRNTSMASPITPNYGNNSLSPPHHHVTKHPNKHVDHQKRNHHQHRHQHQDRNEDIIFEIGYPQNLKGTILGVAKEYDPQHLFSGEDANSSVLQPVTAAEMEDMEKLIV